MGKVTQTSSRKTEHIRINLDEDVSSSITSGLEQYRFEHQALPELNLSQVNLETEFLGKTLRAPILISSMTGGTDEAERLNQRLAIAAQEAGIAMGVGSQRAALENSSLDRTFQIRKFAPDILLFANLGVIQLNYGYGVDECFRAVEMVGADGLILHLNALQEAVQPDGDTDFSGIIQKIEHVCNVLGVPVIAKEVGWGISERAAKSLINAGVAAIDVAGAGGTSWSQVEMYRAKSPSQARLAASFRDWGIPTAQSILNVRNVDQDIPLIASGGVRTGVDIAKCIALGADIGGMASPFLKAAAISGDETLLTIREIKQEIQVAMFAAGVKDIEAL
ncbi:MAG: type 2 isopentenyl-diphosphate Delta-isomerase, partial [Anaerolineales bacterium]|nr:type 2 isopentenyl-diphosphate Delta-isomerase [Anaerolineales bacterium]